MGTAVFIAIASLLANPLGLLAIIGIIIYAAKHLYDKIKSDERAKKYGWDPLRWDKERGNLYDGLPFSGKQGSQAYARKSGGSGAGLRFRGHTVK